MIEVDRRPVRTDVAVLAHVGRLDVIRRLSRRRGAVVAGTACPGHIRMIDPHGRPGGRDMAVLADIRGGDVVYGLAGCRRAVVAGGAGARDL